MTNAGLVLDFGCRGDDAHSSATERAMRDQIARLTAERDGPTTRLDYFEREVFGDELVLPDDWRLTITERRARPPDAAADHEPERPEGGDVLWRPR